MEIGLADKDRRSCLRIWRMVFARDAPIPASRKVKQNMRSENVFAAAKRINNRFLLCRVTSASAHRLQKSPRQFTESINKSLKLIADMSPDAGNGSATAGLRISMDHLFLSSVRNIERKPLGEEPTFEPLLDIVPAG